MLRIVQSKDHNQLLESNLWSIKHNLSRSVIVDVFIPVDGVLTKILPRAVRIINPNLVEVEFSTPYKGVARIV
jgi:hypothetical protein